MRKRERLWGVLQKATLPEYAKRTSPTNHPNPIMNSPTASPQTAASTPVPTLRVAYQAKDELQ